MNYTPQAPNAPGLPPVGAPMPQQTPAQTNTLAVVGFVLSLLCVSLPALILGIIGLSQINASEGRQTGKGFAIAAIVISAAGMFFSIMAILALIAIPRVAGAGRKAKEATLKGNLHEIRNAIEQFQADTGVFPTYLEDIVATSAPATGVNSNGKRMKIAPGSYKGPYLTRQGGLDNSGIPMNPFQKVIPSGTLQVDITAHWTYINGVVNPAVPTEGTTLDDIPYQKL